MARIILFTLFFKVKDAPDRRCALPGEPFRDRLSGIDIRKSFPEGECAMKDRGKNRSKTRKRKAAHKRKQVRARLRVSRGHQKF